jgi:hypothetical protein
VDSFVTAEDYAFIDRLPPNGQMLSRPDSLFLAGLHSRLFDQYAARAIYEESFSVMLQVLQKNKAEQKWIDLLQGDKEAIFRQLMTKEGDYREEDFMVEIVASRRIPVSIPNVRRDYHTLSKGFKARLNFMSESNDGTYLHHIQMPWSVIADTNADSVRGQELYWHPPVEKFLLKDYTLFARVQKFNYWTLLASAIVIAISFALVLKGKAKKQ